MRVRILSVYFNRSNRYSALRTVFERSAAKHMRGVPVEIINLPMPKLADHREDTATAFIAAASRVLKIDEPVAVCDIDLMFRGDITEAFFDRGFDVGITTRSGFKHPYNTGVWFYRPTDKAREFVTAWIAETRHLASKRESNLRYIIENGGIDQASLATMIRAELPAKVLHLPCHAWNAEQSSWKDMTEDSRVVHIKSGLRSACLGGPVSEKLREQWPDDEKRGAAIAEFKGYL